MLHIPVLTIKTIVLQSFVGLEGKKTLFCSYWSEVLKGVRSVKVLVLLQYLIPLSFTFLSEDVVFDVSVI